MAQLVHRVCDRPVRVRRREAMGQGQVLAPRRIAEEAAGLSVDQPGVVPAPALLAARSATFDQPPHGRHGDVRIMAVRTAARVFLFSRTSRRPPHSLAVRSMTTDWSSTFTLSMRTATASSQRGPTNARTMATSPRPGLK